METFLTVVHVSVAIFMILVVLIQGGNQGGIGAAFGGGNSQGVFGASGATTLLGKLTYGAAAIFMATSLMLTVSRGGNLGFDDAAFEKVKQEQMQSAITSPEDSSKKSDGMNVKKDSSEKSEKNKAK